MEPLGITSDDCGINSKYKDIIHGSSMLSIPLIRCDDQVLNGIIKQENIDNQVFDGIIKEEIIEEMDHNNDSRSFQIGSRVVPLPLNMIYGDQAVNKNTKMKIVDDQKFNGFIKEEIIDGTDPNNENQLLQKGTKTEEKVETEIKTEVNYIDCFEFEGTVVNKSNSENFITCTNLDLTSNRRRKNPLSNCDKMTTASKSTKYTRTITAEKPFKCDNCDKAFSLKSSIIRHTRTHTGEKRFKCDNCDKAFFLKTDLIRHMRTHTGAKSFKCDNCDKAFSLKSNLIRHTRTHTGEKPYKCDNCDKSFSQSTNLTSHKRTHTGEKPFKCDNCDKAFSMKSSLMRHKRTHTQFT